MSHSAGSAGGTDAALAAILRSSSDAVIAKTVDGVITAWNEGAEKLYGRSAADMIGQSIDVTFPPATLADERARHARVAAGAAETGYRCVRLRGDGTPVTVVMSLSPIRGEDGRVTGIGSISRPLSAGELGEERGASLLDAAPDAMICVDAGGRITLVNAQAAALFGYPRDQLVGAQVEMLLPEGMRAHHPKHRAVFARDPRPRPMGTGLSLRARRADGSTFPVEISLSEGPDRSGLLAIAAVRDVTAQRATEVALRESEVRLRQLADNVDTVFTLQQLDPPAVLYRSHAWSALTGYSEAEADADPDIARRVIHPDDLERVELEVLERQRRGMSARSEFRIRRADGEIRWVRTSVSPVADAAGPAQRTVMVTEDITARIEAAEAISAAEAEARSANEAKNVFLSRMSHELRTPLNAVLGFGQLLEYRLRDTEHAEPVSHVLRAGRHLLSLIDEILDVARIESGELTVSIEPVAAEIVVEEAGHLMLPIADAARIGLRVAGGPSCFLLTDRQRIRQVLLNLISNAIKYNRPEGRVVLSWSVLDGEVAISVTDDGAGIPAALQDRLFAPFDRLGAEATSVEGTGIGLTVTRGLVELMGGRVTVRSIEGTGTTFTIALPSTDGPGRLTSAPVPRWETSAPPAEAVAATLLYIEDNQPNVRVMESVLELRDGWRLIHAALGGLGVDLARAHLPDLVLLDLHLPDQSGLDVLASLRNDRATAAIPVVVLSADANANQVQRLLAAGATQYLTKPLVLGEVLAILDGVAASKAAT